MESEGEGFGGEGGISEALEVLFGFEGGEDTGADLVGVELGGLSGQKRAEVFIGDEPFGLLRDQQQITEPAERQIQHRGQ